MKFDIVTHQVIVMFLLMAAVHAHTWHLIHNTGAKDMTRILLYIVSPCVIIEAFQQKFSAARLYDLLTAFLFIGLVFLPAILSARLLFNKRFVADNGNQQTLKLGSDLLERRIHGFSVRQCDSRPAGIFYATLYLAVVCQAQWSIHRLKRGGAISDAE